MTFANAFLTNLTTLFIGVPAYYLWHAMRTGTDLTEGLVAMVLISIAVVGALAAIPTFIAFAVLWCFMQSARFQERWKGAIAATLSAWVGISFFFGAWTEFIGGYGPAAEAPAIEILALSALAGAVAFLVWAEKGTRGA